MLEDLRSVSGKQYLLFQIADATLTHPDGIVRDVVFPIVNEGTLRALVKEWKVTGPTYRTTATRLIRNSYQSHYRKMVPQLLRTLEFRSNNELHQPMIRALDLLNRYADFKLPFYPVDEDVPLDFVLVSGERRSLTISETAGRALIESRMRSASSRRCANN